MTQDYQTQEAEERYEELRKEAIEKVARDENVSLKKAEEIFESESEV